MDALARSTMPGDIHLCKEMSQPDSAWVITNGTARTYVRWVAALDGHMALTSSLPKIDFVYFMYGETFRSSASYFDRGRGIALSSSAFFAESGDGSPFVDPVPWVTTGNRDFLHLRAWILSVALTPQAIATRFVQQHVRIPPPGDVLALLDYIEQSKLPLRALHLALVFSWPSGAPREGGWADFREVLRATFPLHLHDALLLKVSRDVSSEGRLLTSLLDPMSQLVRSGHAALQTISLLVAPGSSFTVESLQALFSATAASRAPSAPSSPTRGQSSFLVGSPGSPPMAFGRSAAGAGSAVGAAGFATSSEEPLYDTFDVSGVMGEAWDAAQDDSGEAAALSGAALGAPRAGGPPAVPFQVQSPRSRTPPPPRVAGSPCTFDSYEATPSPGMTSGGCYRFFYELVPCPCTHPAWDRLDKGKQLAVLRVLKDRPPTRQHPVYPLRQRFAAMLASA